MATAAAATVDIAAAYGRTLTETGSRLALVLTRLWRTRVDPADPVGSWRAARGDAVAAFTAGQTVAAQMADSYVSQALTAQGWSGSAAGAVDPAAFAGTAATGLTLDDLLQIPADRADAAIGAGAPAGPSLQGAESLLVRYARTEVADAGRLAGLVSGVSHGAAGYVRTLRPPSCARCAILAGRFYRWSSGFQRHPACDCANVPVQNEHDATGLTTDPRQAILSGQVHGLSDAEHTAIRLGADPSQVVNARDGMYVAGGRSLTTTGTTRRGVAGARLLARDMDRARGAPPGGLYRNLTVSRGELAQAEAHYGALMRRGNQFTRHTATGQVAAYRFTRTARASVEEILRTATDREDAIRVLINNGYIL